MNIKPSLYFSKWVPHKTIIFEGPGHQFENLCSSSNYFVSNVRNLAYSVMQLALVPLLVTEIKTVAAQNLI